MMSLRGGWAASRILGSYQPGEQPYGFQFFFVGFLEHFFGKLVIMPRPLAPLMPLSASCRCTHLRRAIDPPLEGHGLSAACRLNQ